MMNTFIDDFPDKFNNLTKKPEKFLSAPDKLIDTIKGLIKETYDFSKKEETNLISYSLPQLIVDDFDTEQIWQQIELQNESILTEYLSSVSKLVAAKERLWFINNSNDESDINQEENESDNELENNDEDISEENDSSDSENSDDKLSDIDTSIPKLAEKSKPIKSDVDDDFFKLDEMEQFLKKEERNYEKSNSDVSDDEESVDLFEKRSEDIEDDSERDSESEFNPKYDDFFGEEQVNKNKKRKKDELEINQEDEYNILTENKRKKVNFQDDVNEDENEEFEENNIKSSLELREERLKRRIEDVEKTALEEKSWQLKGEVTADKRPQNSLLEEIVDFDLTVRPAPVVTEETTMRLEDVIKQRIKDKVWDDVERKTKLIESPLEYKKKLMLDQEKSKQSLAQIYEQEYIKQQDNIDPDRLDKPEEEPKEHVEIKSMMKSLFTKLDALANFHFTPKTVAPELKIVSNLPAINMEEVAPVATSDATLLAPEEIRNKSKGDEIGKNERTGTDKKRERRKKKLKQKEHAKLKNNKEKLTEKVKPGLGNKYSKQKTAKLLQKVTKERNIDKMNESKHNKSLKSSTAFFSQLQDEIKSQIKSKSASQNKKSKQSFTAKKLKL